MANQNSKKSKSKANLLVILIIIIILALLVICFKDRIFTSDTKAEGSLLVTGKGTDLYYVYNSKDNQKIDFISTGKTMSLPVGKYKVTLHNIGPEITVKGDDMTVLHTGVLLVEGQGLNLYEVWDEKKKTKLNFTYTGKGFEFFPGSYTIILNNIPQKLTVKAEDTTWIATGRLSVTGKPETLYYVYDQTGDNQLQFTYTGKETELFPGKYWIRVDKDKKQIDIVAGEVTEVAF